ncbi:hypothetical protein DJ66_1237 [Candidatus Liberibacter solanacearum]|uniref:Uncharacterized protein n=1 Tax=Candidatus Liberibacter solanacearum TaxID=556287 RepID=A0A0F4VJD3_9HYPH|nr:hypothetical protein DJ66_1237 [Candidatus Liberibacter solanacearum]
MKKLQNHEYFGKIYYNFQKRFLNYSNTERKKKSINPKMSVF